MQRKLHQIHMSNSWEANPYNKSAVSQLRDCLKLQNNPACLNIIVDNILDVGRRHIDPDILASHQKDALVEIGEELGGLYPDIFSDKDSARRIYIALQIVMDQHSLKRQGLKKKKGKERNPAPKSKSHIQHSLSAPKRDSGKRDVNYVTDKPSRKVKAEGIRRSLQSTSGRNEQDENQAPMNKASDMRSAYTIPHIGRPPLTPMQGDEENEDQARMQATGEVFDRRKTTKISNTQCSPSGSMQGPDKQDEDHAPMNLTMDATDVVSHKKTKNIPSLGFDYQDEDRVPMDGTVYATNMISNKVTNIPVIRRSFSTPSQGFDAQDKNQTSMDVTVHNVTEKASGKMAAKQVLYNRYSSLIPTQEQDEDQAPINVEMHPTDQVSDRKDAEMSPSERMTLRLTSIANIPSAPGKFASPSFRVNAPQPSEGVSSLLSQPRGPALSVPHAQLQLDNTPSQPAGTTDDPCSEHFSVSKSHPVSADASSNLSASIDSPMHGSMASQSDKVKSVHHFLEACVPSMSYLLPRFIDYGCTHEGFLLAVSMWPPERIRKFLEDVVTGPNGELISPMEQMVLENHLTQYFKV